MLDIDHCSPQDWVRSATLLELWELFRAQNEWSNSKAESFDYVYRWKMFRLIENRDISGLDALRVHLHRLVPPLQRDKLNVLLKPYATYWESYASLIDHYIGSMQVIT